MTAALLSVSSDVPIKLTQNAPDELSAVLQRETNFNFTFLPQSSELWSDLLTKSLAHTAPTPP